MSPTTPITSHKTPHGENLTERQLQVLLLAGRGLNTIEIGAALGLTRRTAKDHLDVLRKKYGVSHVRHLIPIARCLERELEVRP